MLHHPYAGATNQWLSAAVGTVAFGGTAQQQRDKSKAAQDKSMKLYIQEFQEMFQRVNDKSGPGTLA
jgi:hypothetical protein